MYDRGNGIYELTCAFDSDWGFLIRTSTSSWAQGTKYGAADDKTVIKFDVPFRLVSNQTANPVDIRFSEPEFFHSHFWTSTFADLNYGPASEAERSGAFAALTEAADKWVEMGVDGFRLDAVKHIYHNQDSDENPVFLKKFYDRMNDTWHRTGGQGDFYMVGEMLDGSSKAAPYYKGLPALFEFDFWYRLSWALQNGTGCYFAKDIMSYRDAYRTVRPDYIAAVKLSNHDENRTGSELGGDVDKMKVAAAVLLTASGEPYIYQGEELGYTGTKDNGDEYVRTPVMWDRSGAEIAAGALDGKVDMAMLVPGISVEAQEKDGNSLLNVYRTFSMLRNTYPALAHGQMERHPVYNDTNDGIPSVAAWYMTDGEDRMLVLHNFAGRNVTLSLDDDLSRPVALLGRAAVKASGGGYQLLLDGLSSVVFEL